MTIIYLSRHLQWLGKLDIARSKFGRQCIRVRNTKVSVPAGRRLSLVIRQWIYTNALKHDHRTPSAHDAEEGVVSGLQKGDLWVSAHVYALAANSFLPRLSYVGSLLDCWTLLS